MPMLEEFKASGLSDTHANRNVFALAYAAGHGDGSAAGMARAAEICMTAAPNAETRKAIGDAAHYVACADAIRAEITKEAS